MTTRNSPPRLFVTSGRASHSHVKSYLAVLLTGLFLLVMPIARAAQVDWVVNIKTDKDVYYSGQLMHVTVTVDQAADVTPAGPPTLVISGETGTLSSARNVVCTATGGATCPTLPSPLVDASTGKISLPIAPFTKQGRLIFTMDMDAAPYVQNVSLAATLHPGPGDTEINDQTNVSIQSPGVLDAETDFASTVTSIPSGTQFMGSDFSVSVDFENVHPLFGDIMTGRLGVSWVGGMSSPAISEITCTPLADPSECDLSADGWVKSGTNTWVPGPNQTSQQFGFMIKTPAQAGAHIRLTAKGVIPKPPCTDVPQNAEFQVISYVNPFNLMDSNWSNNSDQESFVVTSPACENYDLQVSGIQINQYGTQLGDPWSATWTMANGGPGPSPDWFAFIGSSWPGFDPNGTVSCVATGGAVCPTVLSKLGTMDQNENLVPNNKGWNFGGTEDVKQVETRLVIRSV